MFSTLDEIRAESGFTGNTYITDSYIEGYQKQANGVLIGYIANIYNISLLSGPSFLNSQAENILKRIELLFASGYLLIAEYGPEAKDSDKDGYRKIEQAEYLCKQILDGNISLFDTNGNEMTKKSVANSGAMVMTGPDYNPSLTPTFTTNMKF